MTVRRRVSLMTSVTVRGPPRDLGLAVIVDAATCNG